jgi:peptide/nickel transport system permease protein
MRRYFIRRLIQSFILLWVVTALFFTFQRLAPGGPQAFLDDPRMTEADKRALMEDWGLHEPIHVQYVNWVSHIVRGDLGRSFQDRRPVWDKIIERVPNTLYLNAAALVLGLAGVPLGVWAAVNRGRLPDHVVRVTTVVVNAMPNWWLGLMLLILTATYFKIFPLGGMYTIGQDSLPNRLWHLALPAIVAATGGWIGFSRIVRSEMLETLGQDYVKTARSKGLPERMVLYRHALRNSLIPIATGLGPTIVGLLGGTVIYERVFSWPGLGRLAYDAALQRDYPVQMGVFLISTVLVQVGYLISDVAYCVVDPRVRLE